MSKFIPFTDNEIYQAAHTEIKSILEAKGEKAERSGSEWMWAANHSVKFRGHIFYDHSTGDKSKDWKRHNYITLGGLSDPL